jgi:hypothetical protein
MRADTTLPDQDRAGDHVLKVRLKGSPESFKIAMERYRPDPIRLLFIAEAPPAYEANRLFYFNDLETGDTLFLEMMKVLYGAEIGFTEGEGYLAHCSAKDIRRKKSQLLDRFLADGYYLIDASEQPMPDDATAAAKLALLRQSLPELMSRARNLVRGQRVPIVLIGAVTHAACHELLEREGFNVVNEALINHPARGGQSLFRKKLWITLDRIGRSE